MILNNSANNDKLNISDVVNNLTTTASGKVLDARQGKVLNDNICKETVDLLLYYEGSSSNLNGNISNYRFLLISYDLYKTSDISGCLPYLIPVKLITSKTFGHSSKKPISIQLTFDSSNRGFMFYFDTNTHITSSGGWNSLHCYIYGVK